MKWQTRYLDFCYLAAILKQKKTDDAGEFWQGIQYIYPEHFNTSVDLYSQIWIPPYRHDVVRWDSKSPLTTTIAVVHLAVLNLVAKYLVMIINLAVIPIFTVVCLPCLLEYRVDVCSWEVFSRVSHAVGV